MDIKKIFIAVASTLSIALTANSSLAGSAADAMKTYDSADWTAMGKSNGGSEIALRVNSVVQVDDGVQFVYQVKTKGKASIFLGIVDCSTDTPTKWTTTGDNGKLITVAADSSASKQMTAKVCKIAHRLSGVATQKAQSRSFAESTRYPTTVYGKSCSAAVISAQSSDIKCDSVKVTGLDDRNSYIYYHFVDEFGNGLVFVTERFTFESPNSAKILAIGKEVGGELSMARAEPESSASCTVGSPGVKINCHYYYEGVQVFGMLRD